MAKVGRLIKALMVQELTTELGRRPNFFVAGVGRLSAVEADTLRKRLHGVQARVLMVKRTLGRQGLLALKLGHLESLLQGSVALVIPGEDFIPAAKLLADFAKVDEDKLVVRGAFVDGQLLDKGRFTELANLPSRPQLLAELIGTLESPMTDVVLTIERLIGELAWIIEEVAKVKPEHQEGANG